MFDQQPHYQCGRQEPLGSAAFEAELRCHLLPALPLGAEQAFGRDETIREHHFVEVMATVERLDRHDLDAWRPEIDDELRESR